MNFRKEVKLCCFKSKKRSKKLVSEFFLETKDLNQWIDNGVEVVMQTSFANYFHEML